MVNLASRKSVMTLYSTPLCIESHCARIVLQEKGVAAEVEYVDLSAPPDDLVELNPYASTPTLIDRELALFDAPIIIEYLDERFPHPPLHPMDPVSRARARMLIHRIQKDWYALANEIEAAGEKKSMKTKKMLKQSLLSSAPLFAAKPFFMSDEFSLVDCFLAPLLWRLPSLGIDFPKQTVTIRSYASKIFERRSFQKSLSDMEQELADPPKLMIA